MSVLEEIVEHKRREVAARKVSRPLAAVQRAADTAPDARDFAAALRSPGLSVIAEIKRRSPAKGDLRVDLDPVELARRYERYGASAMSVLTDERYFKGSDDDLVVARAAVNLPVLRKDFTIDEYQLYEARALGADAVLLIVRALSDSDLKHLLGVAQAIDLAALVEVHDEAELERAVHAGAALLGVNNRNLDTLTVDPATSLRLAELIPSGSIGVSESGISDPALAARLALAGYQAILVGEALVMSSDPGRLLQAFKGAGEGFHPPTNGELPEPSTYGDSEGSRREAPR